MHFVTLLKKATSVKFAYSICALGKVDFLSFQEASTWWGAETAGLSATISINSNRLALLYRNPYICLPHRKQDMVSPKCPSKPEGDILGFSSCISLPRILLWLAGLSLEDRRSLRWQPPQPALWRDQGQKGNDAPQIPYPVESRARLVLPTLRQHSPPCPMLPSTLECLLLRTKRVTLCPLGSNLKDMFGSSKVRNQDAWRIS